jgi:hypothetical protein
MCFSVLGACPSRLTESASTGFASASAGARFRDLTVYRYRQSISPFDIAEIDRPPPDGGLPLGALHEVPGVEVNEEDDAATAGFIAAILARLDTGLGSAEAPQALLCRRDNGKDDPKVTRGR